MTTPPENEPGSKPEKAPEAVRASASGVPGTALPERPAPPPFSSSLPEIEPLPRPRVVLVVALLVAIAVLLQVWFSFLGLMDSARIRTDLTKELSEEASDFSRADVRKAVNIFFAVSHGIGVLFLLGIVYNLNGLLSRRVSGRTGLTVLTLLFVPVAVMNLVLRLGDENDLLGTGIAVGALLVAVALSFLGSVSAWLHQLERTYRIPMDRPTRTEDQATAD